LFDNQSITVQVTDLPVAPPVITSNGGGDTASVTLNENTAAVTTVVASQTDGPLLAYAISGGVDAAWFQIDPASGELSFINPPDVEAPTDAGGDNTYDVTVRASVGALFDEQAITVDITGIPDGRPIIAAHLGDVLWQHDDRTLATFDGNIGMLPPGSVVAGIGDFDRDGDSDILISNADRTADIWELDGDNHVATHNLPAVSNGWEIRGVGDFDRDGDSDILWFHVNDGSTVLWEIEAAAYVANHNLPSAGSHLWRVVGTGDFDGDGDSDILWHRDADRPIVVWEMENSAFVINNNLPHVSDAWEVSGTGDFDGDGNDDVVWRDDDVGVMTWEIGHQSVISRDLPDVTATWRIQGVEDFDGDGDDDLLWRHDQGRVVTWDMEDGGKGPHHIHGVTSNQWHILGTGAFDLV
jgi:hypothetical protein